MKYSAYTVYSLGQCSTPTSYVCVSALRLEGWGSISGWVIPKTLKMGPNASLLDTQLQGLDWGSLINGLLTWEGAKY